MQAIRIETVVQRDGTLTVDNLPLQAGDAVEVIILLHNAESRQPSKSRKAGSARGLIWMSDDFDEPLEDFREYTE